MTNSKPVKNTLHLIQGTRTFNQTRKIVREVEHELQTKCDSLEHDFKHLIRKGRADWRCPKCGENVMLLLVYAADVGIDLTK